MLLLISFVCFLHPWGGIQGRYYCSCATIDFGMPIVVHDQYSRCCELYPCVLYHTTHYYCCGSVPKAAAAAGSCCSYHPGRNGSPELTERPESTCHCSCDDLGNSISICPCDVIEGAENYIRCIGFFASHKTQQRWSMWFVMMPRTKSAVFVHVDRESPNVIITFRCSCTLLIVELPLKKKH